MGLSTEEELIVLWIGFAVGLISLILSCFTLYIIRVMCIATIHAGDEQTNPIHDERTTTTISDKDGNATTKSITSSLLSLLTATSSSKLSRSTATKFNGYLLIIASMSCCQILYDLNYMLGITSTFAGCVAWHFLDMLGGLSVTIWTNILSFIIYFVVTFIQSVVRIRNFDINNYVLSDLD